MCVLESDNTLKKTSKGRNSIFGRLFIRLSVYSLIHQIHKTMFLQVVGERRTQTHRKITYTKEAELRDTVT